MGPLSQFGVGDGYGEDAMSTEVFHYVHIECGENFGSVKDSFLMVKKRLSKAI